MKNKVLSMLTNSESEVIEIQVIGGGPFKGQHLLVIVADNGVTQAPHLLDKATVEFLLKELPTL